MGTALKIEMIQPPGLQQDLLTLSRESRQWILSLLAERSERAWLIESETNGCPVWYMGTSEPIRWTFDASKAVWFVRERDAQAVVDAIGFKGPPVRVTEHEWMDRP